MIDTIIRVYKENSKTLEFIFPYETFLGKRQLKDHDVVRVAIGSLDTKEYSRNYSRLYGYCEDQKPTMCECVILSGSQALHMKNCLIVPTKYPFGYFFEFESEIKDCWQMNISEAQNLLI